MSIFNSIKRAIRLPLAAMENIGLRGASVRRRGAEDAGAAMRGKLSCRS
jgi:hypothetical protein